MTDDTSPNDDFAPSVRDDVHMKPLLGLAVQEAVRHAIADSVDLDHLGLDIEGRDRRRAQIVWDVHSVTDKEWMSISPSALARNVACRLLGTGGWQIGSMYAGNATPREILDACVHRPDQDPLGDIKHILGIRESEGEA